MQEPLKKSPAAVIDALDGGRVFTWTETRTGMKFQAKYSDVLTYEIMLNYKFATDDFVSFKEWLGILGIDIPVPDSDILNIIGWSTWQIVDAYGFCWIPIDYQILSDGSFGITYPVEPNSDYLDY